MSSIRNAKFRMENFLLLVFATLCPMHCLFAQYHCDWNVVSGGGGFLTTTNFQASTSAIQTAIGFSQSSGFQIFSGFFTFETLFVGVKEPERSPIEQKLVTQLYSNNPNPFSSQTTIRYSLANEMAVSLKIYDITGREVLTLTQGKQKRGVYTLNWNGRDERDARFPAGIYFYKLLTPDYKAIKKMVLTK